MKAVAFAFSLAAVLVASGCNEAPPAEAAYCVGVPQLALQGRVTDAAAILSDEEEMLLSERLAQYEAQNKHQMVVATVPSLNGARVDNFGTCLGNRWKIGREDHNDGIVILIAPTERRINIATGTGMEIILTDDKALAVIHQMMPQLKQADYAGSLSTGVNAIAAQTGGTP